MIISYHLKKFLLINFFIKNRYMEYNTLLGINVLLVCLCLSAIVVIVVMMFQNSTLNEEMNKELKEIEKKCPDCKCPECPKNPDCNVNCPDCNCPECPEPSNDSKPNVSEQAKVECPKCPSVEDIVAGVFPGRNPKVVDGGRYFQVDASNSYDDLSTNNFYEKNYNFPIDKILKPDEPAMKNYNIGGEEEIDNSIENENIDTNKTRELPDVNKDDSGSNKSMEMAKEIEENINNDTTPGSPINQDSSYAEPFYQKILPDNF